MSNVLSVLINNTSIIYITDTMASYRIEFHQFISEGQIAKKQKNKKTHNKIYKKE
jgi:hypothetical protein